MTLCGSLPYMKLVISAMPVMHKARSCMHVGEDQFLAWNDVIIYKRTWWAVHSIPVCQGYYRYAHSRKLTRAASVLMWSRWGLMSRQSRSARCRRRKTQSLPVRHANELDELVSVEQTFTLNATFGIHSRNSMAKLDGLDHFWITAGASRKLYFYFGPYCTGPNSS